MNIEQFLQKNFEVWEGSTERLSQLKEAKYKSGQNVLFIQNEQTSLDLADILVNYRPFNDALAFVASCENEDNLRKYSPLLKPFNDKIQLELINLRSEQKGVKGIGKCNSCGGTEITFTMKQMRSGDEPETILCRCCSCGKFWKK
jgi:DNA-directed RNA polymerase subunit M/transcription elongation factor TFIIS